MATLPDYIVINWHKRYTGVSATVKHLVPIQQETCDIAVIDRDNFSHTWPLWRVVLKGWTA